MSAAYPSNEVVFNVSKRTTKTEVIRIEGMSDYRQRINMLNFSAGPTNAVQICNDMFDMPTMDQWLNSI